MSSPSGHKTAISLSKHFPIRECSIGELNKSQWERYASLFCDFLLSLYSPDKIIVNKFHFARSYYNGIEFIEYPTLHRDLKWEEITSLVEAMFIEKLSGCKVLEYNLPYIGNPNHRLGFSSLHYTDEIYYAQAKSLEALLLD